MDIIGRSCMLITSESLTAKEPLAYRDLFFFLEDHHIKKMQTKHRSIYQA